MTKNTKQDTLSNQQTHPFTNEEVTLFGKLHLTFKKGRHGRFPVGTFCSDFGEFTMINKELEQFESGVYEVEGVNPSVFTKFGVSGPTVFVNRRIRFEEIRVHMLSNAKPLSSSAVSSPAEEDPAVDESTENPSSTSSDAAAVDEKTNAVLKALHRGKKGAVSTPASSPSSAEEVLILTKELKGQDFSQADIDCLLDGRTFSLAEVRDLVDDGCVVLDDSSDRLTIREKRALLARNGFKFDYNFGYWSKPEAA